MIYFFTILYYIALWVYVLLITLAPYAWYFENFIHYIPQFYIGALIGLILLIWQKKYLLMFPLVLIIIFFSWQILPLYFPITWQPNLSEQAKELKLMQVNVNYLNTNYDKLVGVIEKESPAIISLNEVTDVWLAKIVEAVGDRYQYAVVMPSEDYRGMAVISQLPIEEEVIYYYGEEDSPVIVTNVIDHDLTLYSAHTLPPISKHWAKSRDSLLKGVSGLVANTSGSVIVIGDLNTTIHSSVLRSMLDLLDLKDSRRAQGWKPSWFYGTPMAVAIDHVLYRGDNIVVKDVKVGPGFGSDHRPIIVELLIDHE